MRMASVSPPSNPYQLRKRPPPLVAVAKLFRGSAWKGHLPGSDVGWGRRRNQPNAVEECTRRDEASLDAPYLTWGKAMGGSESRAASEGARQATASPDFPISVGLRRLEHFRSPDLWIPLGSCQGSRRDESPASRCSIRIHMGILVPENTGVPPRMSGFLPMALLCNGFTSVAPLRYVGLKMCRCSPMSVGRHGAASNTVRSNRFISWKGSSMCPVAPGCGQGAIECLVQSDCEHAVEHLLAFLSLFNRRPMMFHE